ncbi:hypothetical protein Ppro_1132 [Pelobacter propionicus DSM 2379]|uniref:Uncharacterized protein n=1 Tax=Pelobacter propionicus (strain DSM 2379 / NBRC 103807 / OttBd1) TaxID=338966 RepID=A1AN36_PELPD|nr:hypothetical protein Ppro_1132 [Pelobacter propionicus DSM 2379]
MDNTCIILGTESILAVVMGGFIGLPGKWAVIVLEVSMEQGWVNRECCYRGGHRGDRGGDAVFRNTSRDEQGATSICRKSVMWRHDR